MRYEYLKDIDRNLFNFKIGDCVQVKEGESLFVGNEFQGEVGKVYCIKLSDDTDFPMEFNSLFEMFDFVEDNEDLDERKHDAPFVIDVEFNQNHRGCYSFLPKELDYYDKENDNITF